MKRLLQIGVQVERSRAHGRGLLEGLAEFARAQYDWRLTLLEPERLGDPAALARFDGFIVRVMDDAASRALRAESPPLSLWLPGVCTPPPLPGLRVFCCAPRCGLPVAE